MRGGERGKKNGSREQKERERKEKGAERERENASAEQKLSLRVIWFHSSSVWAIMQHMRASERNSRARVRKERERKREAKSGAHVKSERGEDVRKKLYTRESAEEEEGDGDRKQNRARECKPPPLRF